MSKKIWSKADIPNLSAKLAIVTGSTSGVGYETALGLAEAGATVIIAGRNKEKGANTLKKIYALCPAAKIEFGQIDLSSLTSVKEFVENTSKKYESLDILVNNAGRSTPATRETTKDGFEITFGTNYLAHFALTALLLPLLRKSPSPRVVTVSSGLYKQGKINFEDLQSEKCKYGTNVFAQSKLANLLFALELQRKSDDGQWGLSSYAVNPGFSRTEGVANMRGFFGWATNHLIAPLFSQSAADGALPSLYAATCPDAKGGLYYAPKGMMEMKGAVAPVELASNAKDVEVATKLWDVSVNLTNVTWP